MEGRNIDNVSFHETWPYPLSYKKGRYSLAFLKSRKNKWSEKLEEANIIGDEASSRNEFATINFLTDEEWFILAAWNSLGLHFRRTLSFLPCSRYMDRCLRYSYSHLDSDLVKVLKIREELTGSTDTALLSHRLKVDISHLVREGEW